MGIIKSEKKKKKKFYIMFFLILLVCFVVGAFGYMYFYLHNLSASSKKNNIKLVEAKKDEPINILIMGVDVGTLGDKSSGNAQRTDTIILMNYNPSNKAINLISIPRDTLILIDGKMRKIND